MAAIREGVALSIDRSTRVVRLAGPDARAAALWLLPSRLYLRDAQARQSLLLDHDGRPIADVIVCADDEDYLLLVEGLETDALLEHLRANVARMDVRIEELGAELGVISLLGPWSWELVAEVLGPDLVALPYLNFFRIDEGICVRAGKTGEYGYELLVSHAQPERVLAAIERRRADGGTRVQTCVVASGPIARGDRVRLGDRTIGEVTRAAFSPALGAWLAAALVEPALAHGGITTLTIAHGDAEVAARTAAPPLVDNRSLYIDPRRHSYRGRDELKLGPLVRAARAQLGGSP